ncbi:MAG: grasp-with-spasm system SPASM domain peptide maturase [Salinivirgaceae bacterium]|nr:grasp-with-spasm system SPASM domain peptide maturase [Salinivirgaceae bacterium]
MKAQSNFNFWPNCFLVNGFQRILIQDVQKGVHTFLERSTIDNSINKYGYFNSKQQHSFSNLSLAIRYPVLISNAEICLTDKIEYEEVFKTLENINCKAIYIRILDSSSSIISLFFQLINKYAFQSVELAINYSEESYDIISSQILNTNNINSIFFFSAPNRGYIPRDNEQKFNLFFTKESINESTCGNISEYYQTNNLSFYTESQHYNTCLNRKVCIDENGFIKNCLSIDEHYGNINEVDLKEVVQSEEFQKLWHIKKDEIKVCKDCEFRHMCMDCRAFIKNPNDIYSQPSKCHYNPYIAKWKGQEGYISVEDWQKLQAKKVED